MGKMTFPQSVARPLINFLVERLFPNGLFFYGSGPLQAFDNFDKDKKTVVGGFAALSLAKHAHNSGAEKLVIDAEEITINEQSLGDWRITVERINK